MRSSIFDTPASRADRVWVTFGAARIIAIAAVAKLEFNDFAQLFQGLQRFIYRRPRCGWTAREHGVVHLFRVGVILPDSTSARRISPCPA